MDQKNPRHRKKVLDMLQQFQKLGSITENFSDTHFRSSLMFTSLIVKKIGKIWLVKMAVGEQLLSYNYPYHFTSWKSKYQCQVNFQILQTISFYPLEKQFFVEKFLKQFNVSNKKQTEIKKLIIEVISELITN